ncbi:MAG: 3-oxoacyl-ACP synthase [Flavobacteriia bacterium]|nr:3-oxoacyl-ACP synthase [Flavobacteriia bacterium]
MNKNLVHTEVVLHLQSKIDALSVLLKDVCNSTSEDSKSSAGDKHETSTSMAQLEQEKLSNQIQEFLKMKAVLLKLNPEKNHIKIELGSLVETNKGWFYFSVGLGLIKIKEIGVFCLTPISPIGQLLNGKMAGNSISFNNSETNVINVL